MSVQGSLLFIGVDAAKPSLAIQFPDELRSTANSAQGHAAFLVKLKALGAVHVICEATGGYERALVTALLQTGVAVSAINPRAVARLCTGLWPAGQDRCHRRGHPARLRRQTEPAGHASAQ